MTGFEIRPSPPRRLPGLLIGFLAIFCFTAGAYLDRYGVLPGSYPHSPPGAAKYFKVFWEAWGLVTQHYVDQKAVDPQKMTYGAIQGMLDTLGDIGHTQFLPPAELKIVKTELEGHFVGIGTEIAMKDNKPTIVAPLVGSPAAKAGLKPGDVLVKVNGADVRNLPLDRIVAMVRGREGTKVRLTLLRQGRSKSRLVELTIVRADVKIMSVTWTRVPGLPLVHLAIHNFYENTTSQLTAELTKILAEKPKGLIVDLRNDPGGLLDQAVTASSQFLRSGDVLIERDAKGRQTRFPVKPGGLATTIPLVLLINHGTGSSAEIMAGAIQDHYRGPLIGRATFGLGTVLEPFRLTDGSAVLLAAAEWLTPKGRSIWHHGIQPDIPVDLPNPSVQPLTPEVVGTMTPAELKTTQDTQFKRAVEELRKRAG